MVRTSIALAIVVVVATTAGCTMCCHPYDYCGPVYEGQGRYATGCSRCARAGSTLTQDSSVAMQSSEMPEQTARRPTQTARKPVQTASARVKTRAMPQRTAAEDVPGATQIISVTDRAVDSPAAASDSETPPAKLAVETAQPLSAAGWTARRSVDETLR